MIRHIVLVRFAAATPSSEQQAIIEQLRRLQDVVPGLRAFAAGADVSPEGLARGYTHALTLDFDDAAARDEYLRHPDHQAAGARLVAAAEGGIAGILVVDFAL